MSRSSGAIFTLGKGFVINDKHLQEGELIFAVYPAAILQMLGGSPLQNLAAIGNNWPVYAKDRIPLASAFLFKGMIINQWTDTRRQKSRKL